MATYLSKHFTLEELTETSHRNLDNTPSPEAKVELERLAKDTLESAREIVGPMHINSGFRSPAVNEAVKGQPTSQHMKGQAADCIPLKEGKLKDFCKALVDSQTFVFDQIIYEFGRWIHISHAPQDRKPRMQSLMVGTWTEGKYLPFDYDKIP
jgi:zinc D-Ala-D-Ala carboxypeptidase